MDEIEIWRTAKILIDAHGARAEEEAALCAQYSLQRGNPAALGVWKRVMAAVQVLQHGNPGH